MIENENQYIRAQYDLKRFLHDMLGWEIELAMQGHTPEEVEKLSKPSWGLFRALKHDVQVYESKKEKECKTN